jgi:hypothetical protein
MRTTFITNGEIEALLQVARIAQSNALAQLDVDVATSAISRLEHMRDARSAVDWEGELPLTIGLDARKSLTSRAFRVAVTPARVAVKFGRHVAAFRPGTD